MTRPEFGLAVELGDGIRRIVAPNPGPMTHWGTNTWLFGETDVAVIDPGPDDPHHLAAIQAATKGQRVTHILITHAHADHSLGAKTLSQLTGAPIVAFGKATAGRSDIMRSLAESGVELEGGEGLDSSFRPDECVGDGDQIIGQDWTLDVLHTPGHFAGHLAFRFDDVLFSGDHVMDWSTSIVSPPDGDVRAFLDTCERLSKLDLSRCFTGHGGEISAPTSRLDWLISHRRKREAAILDGLRQGSRDIDELTRDIYRDVPVALHRAASRNVLAHLIDLTERNIVCAEPRLELGARFMLT